MAEFRFYGVRLGEKVAQLGFDWGGMYWVESIPLESGDRNENIGEGRSLTLHPTALILFVGEWMVGA
jgi:hypothetical protein